MKHPIDEYFKKLNQLEEQPPLEAWDFIEDGLNKQDVKKSPLAFLNLRNLAIAASVLFLFGLGIQQLFFSDSTNINTSVVKESLDINKNTEEVGGNGNTTNEFEQSNSNNEQIKSNNQNNLISQSEHNSNQNTNTLNSTNHSESSSTNGSFNDVKKVNNSNKQSILNYNNYNTDFYSLSNQKSENQIQVQRLNGTNRFNQANDSNSNRNNALIPRKEYVSRSNKNLEPLKGVESANPFYHIPNYITKPEIVDAKMPTLKNSEELALMENSDDKENGDDSEYYLKKFDFLVYGAPLFYSSFGGNSSLPELANYGQKNQVSFTYGLKAGYTVANRLQLRTGIAMVNLSEVSENVLLENSAVSSRNSNELEDVEVQERGSINYISDLRIASTNTVNNSNADELIAARKVNEFTADVEQEIQFLEVPIEAVYTLMENKRFNVSATGGVSSYILTDNIITADTGENNFLIGEANNVNNLSFSGNAGMKFDVNVSKNATISVEPQFKYLINTVSDNSDFQPFAMGVNAGLLIKL